MGNVEEVGGQRILGVLLGAALGFVGIGVQHLLLRSRKPQTEAA